MNRRRFKHIFVFAVGAFLILIFLGIALFSYASHVEVERMKQQTMSLSMSFCSGIVLDYDELNEKMAVEVKQRGEHSLPSPITFDCSRAQFSISKEEVIVGRSILIGYIHNPRLTYGENAVPNALTINGCM